MPLNTLLLTLSVLFGTFKNILSKLYGSFLYSSKYIHFFNFLSFAVATVAVYILGFGSIKTISIFTLFMALIYSVLTITSQISYIKAVEIGSVTLSSLFYSCGFIVPTILGTLIWNEKVNTFQIAGFVLLILSFGISAPLKGSKGEKRWVLFALNALLSSGFVGLTQKIFRMSGYKNELNGFLIVSFLIMTFLSLFFYIFDSVRITKKLDFKLPEKRLFITALFMGLCIGLANKINLYLSGVLSSIIFFPLVNGGCIIISGILSYFLFRERLSAVKCIGIAAGIISIVLIGFKF